MLFRSVVLFVFLFSLASTSVSAAEESALSSEPWNKAELDKRLNANLVLNGDFRLSFGQSARIDPGSPAPCWEQAGFEHSRDRSALGSLSLMRDDVTKLTVWAVRYFFRGVERPYDVTVLGDFPEGSSLLLAAIICGANCRATPIPLLRETSDKLVGRMSPGAEMEYVQRFDLVAKGVSQIRSFVVSNVDESEKDSILDRDKKAAPGYCYGFNLKMVGGSMHNLALIAIANLVCLTVIGFLVAYRFYFPLFILISFYMTNVFGIAALYFGASPGRMAQNVLDRDILATFAAYGLMALCAAVMAYGLSSRAVAWLAPPPRPCADISTKLATVCFLGLGSVLVFVNLDSSLNLFSAALHDGVGAAERLALLRSQISGHTVGLKSHYFRLIFILTPVFLSLVLLSKLWDRRAFAWIAVIVGVQCSLLLYNGEKAPLVWYLWAVFYLALTKNFWLRQWLGWIYLSFAGLVTCLLAIGPPSIVLLLDRIVYGSITVGYHVVEIFPAHHQFLNGASITFLGWSIANHVVDLPLLLWRSIFPANYFTHLSGTSTGAIWTEGYANFGVTGILLFAAGFGAITAFMYEVVRRVFTSAVAAATCSFLVFHYASVGESNFTRYLIDFYAIGLLVTAAGLSAITWLCRTAWVSRRPRNGKLPV